MESARWNSPRSVSENVETVSPIVETLSADMEMLSPIGDIGTVSYLGDTVS